MAIDVFHHDSLATTTRLTRDSFPITGATTKTARIGSAYSVQLTPQTTFHSSSGVKKRKLSKQKIGRPLHRSGSTPQLREHGMSDSEADKKRNKLGYQRISIACAHCRRRKIRCLVAEGDPQSRCQNCIRLKKECVFYPVEQQSALESKSQSSKTGDRTGASSTVSSSPPDIGIGKPFDERRDADSFPTVPSNAQGSFQSLPLETSTALPLQGSFVHQDYGYQQRPGQMWTPAHEYPPVASPMQQDHNFARYHHAVMPGDVAPMYGEPMQPPSEAQISHAAHRYQHQQQPGEVYWQHQQLPPPPVRSISYDHIGSVSSSDSYAVSYHHAPHHQHAHMGHMPLSIDMREQSLAAETPGPHSAPIAQHHHNMFPDSGHHYVFHPEARPMPGAGSQAPYNSWYQSIPQYAPASSETPERAPQDFSNYTNQDDRPG